MRRKNPEPGFGTVPSPVRGTRGGGPRSEERTLREAGIFPGGEGSAAETRDDRDSRDFKDKKT
jgi:hypothetical protein